jgi:hypothetical protein
MSNKQIEIEIDKLTKSIENAITGDSFKTEVIPLTSRDLRKLKSSEWMFDWKAEAKDTKKDLYKLVIVENENNIQGLVSIEDKGDHIFMHLIENSKFNKGSQKVYLGVAGNLVAFVCKLSFSFGYRGYVSFEAKTKLIGHYQSSIGARVLFRNYMVLDEKASQKLVAQYFPDFS